MATDMFGNSTSGTGGLFSGLDVSDILIASSQQTQRLAEMANVALSAGIDKFMQEDFEGAVQEFQRSIGIAPRSEYSVEAAHYMASAHIKEGNYNKAIDAYRMAADLDPQRADTHTKLGNLYYSMEKFSEARDAYQEGVDLGSDPSAHFSLGQAMMQMGQYAQAEGQFKEVTRLLPEEVNGYFGLGQLYAKQKDYEGAVEQFQLAVDIDKTFYNAHAEMGFVYSDLGLTEKAEAVFELLDDEAPELADTLSRYMYKTEKPRIEFATLDGSFEHFLGARTQLSILDSYLANAGDTRDYTMTFQFGKPMDMSSIQDRVNWRIGRSEHSGPGQFYNFGHKVPDTEVKLNPVPKRVIYDAESFQATVTFSITQNSEANGTIDPSHIVFKFMGTDVEGNPMDTDADEFMGFSGVL